MAEGIEEVLEERREERTKTEWMRMKNMLFERDERQIRATVEPVVKSMYPEEREAFGNKITEDMVQHLRTLGRDTETELKKYF